MYNDSIKFLNSHEPLLVLWNTALDDVEKNYMMETRFGKTFAAGAHGAFSGWKNLAFNRDTSYSGLLALNSLFPDKMLESLKTIRQVRLNLGWACYPEFVLRGIDGVEIYTELSLDDFRNKFFKASSINKTDDVCWIWCAFDLLMKMNADISEWEWLYGNGVECFRRLYDPFYSDEYGLYFGQPTFIDVGSNGYPPEFGFKTEEARNKGVWLFASSTNCLYYKALRVMEYTAKKLGKLEEVEKWRVRAEKLKEAILENLRFPDGTFTYFMYPDGKHEERREVLGNAFPVLCGVVDGDDAKKCVENYPVTELGAHLIIPFYDNTSSLHNNSTWPFADTFLLLAKEQALGEDFTELNIEILKNMAKENSMCEFRNTVTGQISGQKAQLWSCAALLNTLVRAGYTSLPHNSVKMY